MVKVIDASVEKAAAKEKSFLNLLKKHKNFESIKAAWDNSTLNNIYPNIDVIIQESEPNKAWTNQEVRELKNSIIKEMQKYGLNESEKLYVYILLQKQMLLLILLQTRILARLTMAFQ